MASKSGPWPIPADAPLAEDLSRCVHCGLCLNACPTYVVTGLETESPRGRIYLARAVDEERIPLTATVQSHWDLCLQCRACEAVCPSGVAYGRIMEHVKAQVAADPPAGKRGRTLRRFVLRNVVASPRPLAIACLPLRVYAKLGPLRGLLERIPLPGPIGRAASSAKSVPAHVGRPVRAGTTVASTRGGRPAVLFTGCIMGEVFGDVHRATGRVLARAGFEVSVPATQGCCGALHAHDGDLEFARILARRNIDALEASGAPIILNSAGCGAAMKEYGQLLAHDLDYAERAARFGARVKDFSEVLGPGAGNLERPASVAYQDACHLAHAQRVRQQPRDLLGSIAGATAIETQGADLCCGAAGIYSLVQPEMSASLRTRKADQFRKHNPDIVVTANPGCQMQYEAAVKEAGTKTRVLHLAQILDEAGWAPATTPPEAATPPS